MESKRQTGRTTRMMERAIEFAKHGKKVHVIFAYKIAKSIWKQSELGRKALELGVKFHVMKFNNAELRAMYIPNISEVLIDHDRQIA